MTCSACSGKRLTTTYCGACGERITPRASSSDALLCTVLDGRYFIEQKIAAGGFGTIYRARSIATEQEVAVKLLHAQHNDDPSVSARFRREAVTMSSLANPHTVTTYELGEDNLGNRFIVMELLKGESLAERFLACGTLHWRTVLSILRAVCDSLAEAHALGIVHRDLKPANIFLCTEPKPDWVKVLDFGIAKILHGSNMHDGSELTRIGQAIGTLEYMSPEQLVGGDIDGRTDIYTLGVVAYEMLTGRRPFADATGATGLVTALMTRKPAPPSTVVRGALPPELDGVLLRCLERESPDRYATVGELAAAIDRMIELPAELVTTQRQWGDKGKSQPVIVPVFADDGDEETTWIDSTPPFDAQIVEVAVPPTVKFEDAVRSQLVAEPGIEDLVLPRVRASGTGVPGFDLSDSDDHVASHMPTGARPLIATRYEIARASTEPAEPPPRLAVGSSPLIEEAMVVALPTAPARYGTARIVIWALLLTVIGLGIGMAIVMLADQR
jgi:serine/threonine protein kinase